VGIRSLSSLSISSKRRTLYLALGPSFFHLPLLGCFLLESLLNPILPFFILPIFNHGFVYKSLSLSLRVLMSLFKRILFLLMHPP
jgi:hypothetical protein